jgi:hypothetical protein
MARAAFLLRVVKEKRRPLAFCSASRTARTSFSLVDDLPGSHKKAQSTQKIFVYFVPFCGCYMPARDNNTPMATPIPRTLEVFSTSIHSSSV